MDNTEYKHPEWQKLRLKIMERDGWACAACGAKDQELHVHHRLYRSGARVWEYPDRLLITLCDKCHFASRDTNQRLLQHLHGISTFSVMSQFVKTFDENGLSVFKAANNGIVELDDCWPVLPANENQIPYVGIFTEIVKHRDLAEFIRDMIEAKARAES